MKARKTTKKLTLNKMTIARLEKEEISKIKGGEQGPVATLEKSCYLSDCICTLATLIISISRLA